MSLVESAKFGTFDRWAEPNNLDEFEPHGDPEPFEHGSWEWHDATDENPWEGLIRCGTFHPEMMTGEA